ncbi:uncharacterized protein LOC135834540 isoform X1 [Planococcus citri]|uniref:uncharacterized protein LOC135834540 isoform X1 n=1 Tax=Planococcus citri TaxID=170843 RepID=UPI0031F7F85A
MSKRKNMEDPTTSKRTQRYRLAAQVSAELEEEDEECYEALEESESDLNSTLAANEIEEPMDTPPSPCLNDIEIKERNPLTLVDCLIRHRKKLEKGPSYVFNDKQKLLRWATKHNITRSCYADLVDILKNMNSGTPAVLSNDIRTLLPKFKISNLQIISMPPGKFVYFGIKEILQLPDTRLFNVNDSKLALSINIDGLPVFKSSHKGFWSFLGSINDGPVFIIAAYYGPSKPQDVNQFLKPFVDEVCSFYEGNDGNAYLQLEIENVNRTYEFILEKIIVDAPAKSYILCTKGHTGYFSCTKCKIAGEAVKTTVCFPNHFDAPLRTTSDYCNVMHGQVEEIESERIESEEIESLSPQLFDIGDENLLLDYSSEEELSADEEVDDHSDSDADSDDSSNQVDSDHSTSNSDFSDTESDDESDNDRRAVEEFHLKKTELTRIPNIDLVSRVPLDYMHLILQGVTKRLLKIWLGKLKSKVFLLRDHRDIISKRLEIIASSYFPAEFQRKPEGLKHFSTWKATQFREFLLYIGPSVLHGVVKPDYWENFVVLHSVMRTMCKMLPMDDPSIDEIQKSIYYNAKDNCKEFVKESARLYGKAFISYNVHGLIHLPDDYKNFGPLDNFSAFKYESFLGTKKRYIKSGNRPLEQIINKFLSLLFTRQFVRENFTEMKDVETMYFDVPVLSLKTALNNESDSSSTKVPDENAYERYLKVKFLNCVLRTDRVADSYCVTGDPPNDYFVHVQKILRFKAEDQVYLLVRKFQQVDDLYTHPYVSRRIGLVVADTDHLQCETTLVHFSEFRSKCFAMPLGDDAKKLVLCKYLHQ